MACETQRRALDATQLRFLRDQVQELRDRVADGDGDEPMPKRDFFDDRTLSGFLRDQEQELLRAAARFVDAARQELALPQLDPRPILIGSEPFAGQWAAARDAATVYYRDGSPCPKGHENAVRLVSNRHCVACERRAHGGHDAVPHGELLAAPEKVKKQGDGVLTRLIAAVWSLANGNASARKRVEELLATTRGPRDQLTPGVYQAVRDHLEGRIGRPALVKVLKKAPSMRRIRRRGAA
jgi:hypothetical protein